MQGVTERSPHHHLASLHAERPPRVLRERSGPRVQRRQRSQCGRTTPADRKDRNGSIRARRATEDRSCAVRGRAVAARWSAVPHIADTHGGTGCRAGCRLDGADPAYTQRRRPAPHAANPTFATDLKPAPAWLLNGHKEVARLAPGSGLASARSPEFHASTEPLGLTLA
jgi:hypothetical protein